jgi:Tol biopolymer transport system component
VAILLADFFNLPVAVLHADYHKWSISPSGISAGDPLWSPDGSELFYRDLDAEKLVAVDVETEDKFAAGTPRVLFDDCYFEHIVYGRTYDITPDGQRFVMVKNPSKSHFFQELKNTLIFR